jgi:hypothetical protein
MMTVKEFPKGKVSHRPQTGELVVRILDLIYEYEGELGTAEALGALEMAKLSIYIDAHDGID